MTKEKMKITVKNIDAFEANGDILVLKHAQALYGLDRAVVKRLQEIEPTIEDKLPKPDKDFLIDSKPIENYEKILFIGVPALHEFQYDEIKEFTFRALLRIQHIIPTVKKIVFTIHGAGYGLDAKRAFLSELEGIKKFFEKNIIQLKFNEIIFVERNEQTAKEIKPILKKFLIEHKDVFSTKLKGLSKENFELICKSINEKKAKLPSSKNFGIRELLKAIDKEEVENNVELDIKKIQNILLQFEQKIKETKNEKIDDTSFLFEELNPVFLETQLYIQKIQGNGYQEIAWIVQLYLLNYLKRICSEKKLSGIYFLKKREEVISQIRFKLLNYFGELLIPKNKFPWKIVDEIMKSEDLGKYWEKFEELSTAPNKASAFIVSKS